MKKTFISVVCFSILTIASLCYAQLNSKELSSCLFLEGIESYSCVDADGNITGHFRKDGDIKSCDYTISKCSSCKFEVGFGTCTSGFFGSAGSGCSYTETTTVPAHGYQCFDGCRFSEWECQQIASGLPCHRTDKDACSHPMN